MSKSGAFIKELSYCYLALGLLETSNDIENDGVDYDEIEKRKLDYHTSKQLNRRMDTLRKELVSFLEKHNDVHKDGKAKREALLRSTLIRAERSTIQLDLLACWILYLRFQPNERNFKLYDDFKWIAEKEGQLFAIIELLSKNDTTNKEAEMYELACDVVTLL